MLSNRSAIVLLFGVVLLYVPVQIFSTVARPEGIGLFQVAGITVLAVGGAIAFWCASIFAVIGRGTPAPLAAPRRLVTRGPYQIVRNPMYIGVGLFFIGTSIFYESIALFAYVVLFFLASHFFIVRYEEPTLRHTFGDEYANYCRRVRRWWP